jgi:hypothetical protein
LLAKTPHEAKFTFVSAPPEYSNTTMHGQKEHSLALGEQNPTSTG